MHEDVLDVCLGTRIEIHFAGDAGEAPEVLILKVGAVAPAHHLHGDEVLAAWSKVLGQVEFGFHLGVLAVAHFLAIDPYLEVAGSGAHVQIDVLPFPASGYGDGAAVGAGVVVALLDKGRVAVELGVPGVAYVLVDHVAVAALYHFFPYSYY